MGGTSRSANTNTTTNTQDISNETIGIEDTELAVVAGEGASVQVVTTDLGAVDAARDIAESGIGVAGEALHVNADVVSQSLDFSNDFGEAAFDFARHESEQAALTSQSAIATLSGAVQKVADASRSDSTETFRRIALYAAIALGLVGAIYVFRRG